MNGTRVWLVFIFFLSGLSVSAATCIQESYCPFEQELLSYNRGPNLIGEEQEWVPIQKSDCDENPIEAECLAEWARDRRILFYRGYPIAAAREVCRKIGGVLVN